MRSGIAIDSTFVAFPASPIWSSHRGEEFYLFTAASGTVIMVANVQPQKPLSLRGYRMTHLSTKRIEQAEDALATVRVAQADFWRSVNELESRLGVELVSTIDFRDTDLQTLLEHNN